MELTSTCCAAPIYDDMDICQECKEHCGAYDEEETEYEFAINKWIPILKKYYNE